MKKTSLLFVLAFLACHFLQAQDPIFRKRLTLPIDATYSEPVALSIGEQGIMVAAINEDTKGKAGLAKVWFCNKELELVKTLDFKTDYTLYGVELVSDKNVVYLKMQGQCKTEIHKIEIPSLTSSKLTLPAEVRCGMVNFAVLNGNLIGTTTDKERYYTEVSPSGSTKQDVMILSDKSDGVLSMRSDPLHGLIGIVIEKNYGKISATHGMKFLKQGKLAFEVDIDGEQKNKSLTATFAETPDGGILICGSYRQPGALSDQGMYIAKVKEGVLGEIKYIHYSSFKHFHDEYKEGERERIAARSTTIKPGFDQLMYMHDFRMANGKYYLVGEAYHQEMNDVGGNQTFYGNQYHHATIACLDAEGNLVWDQIFPLSIDGIKTEKHFANVMFLKDRIVLFGIEGIDVGSKTIGLDGQELTPYASHESPGIDGKDVATVNSNAVVWYGNHFIVYGSEYLKTGSGKKQVLFVEDFAFGN
jgi:hypothetical protein